MVVGGGGGSGGILGLSLNLTIFSLSFRRHTAPHTSCGIASQCPRLPHAAWCFDPTSCPVRGKQVGVLEKPRGNGQRPGLPAGNLPDEAVSENMFIFSAVSRFSRIFSAVSRAFLGCMRTVRFLLYVTPWCYTTSRVAFTLGPPLRDPSSPINKNSMPPPRARVLCSTLIPC